MKVIEDAKAAMHRLVVLFILMILFILRFYIPDRCRSQILIIFQNLQKVPVISLQILTRTA